MEMKFVYVLLAALLTGCNIHPATKVTLACYSNDKGLINSITIGNTTIAIISGSCDLRGMK